MDHNNCYSPNRKKPLENRSCTDCLCFFGFGVFIACWIMVAIFAYQNSDQDALVSPTDSAGQKCGSNKNVSNKEFLFFFDITECTSPMIFVHGCKTPQVCVESCPDKDWFVDDQLNGKLFHPDWPKIQKDLICDSPETNKLVNSVEILKNFTTSNKCAKYYIKSTPILNYCVPDNNDALKSILKNTKIVLDSVVDGSTTVKWMNDSKENIKLIADDLIKNYQYILGGLLIALLFSLSNILLLRWFSWVMIWMSLMAMVGLLGFGSYESYKKYVSFNNDDQANSIDQDNGEQQNWSNYVNEKLNKQSTWLLFTIISTSALVILVLIIIFLRKRIRLSIALIVEGSRAILEIKTSLVFPVFQWLLYLTVFLWFFGVATFLSSMKLHVYKVENFTNDIACECKDNYYKDGDWCTKSKWERYCSDNNATCKFAKCEYSYNVSQDFITGLQLFNVFGMFWMMNFVSAFAQMVLAITFASWYWTFHKKDLPFFTLTSSVYKTIRYHLGTIAFGSLIIAICNFIRIILEWLETKLKKYDNAFTRAIFMCMRCFFWLLNKFLLYINRNAYIMCAMYGNNFCTSAKQAFDLLLRNVLRVMVLDKVTDFLFFVGKIVITGATLATFYYEFYNPLEPIKQFAFVDEQPHLNFQWVPLIIVGVGSWIISSTFFHVYCIAVDTLFLCFLEDSEHNDGSSEHPYFMSQRLMNILGTRNVQSFSMR